tara:strand:- start:16223 stop:18580 length:2358 start_codon:yes stop_codon:yes gene_type:complete
MAEIPLNLSGFSGLADGHAGDDDMVTPQPNLRTIAEDGQMVAGLFNPYLRKGYMSPITNTATSVTTDVSPDSEFIASEYDFVEGRAYWADNTNNIYIGSDLGDTSLVQTLTLEASDVATYPDRKFDALYDLQVYQINGERKVFHVGKGLTFGKVNDAQIATAATADDYSTLSMSIRESGSTQPSILGSARTYSTSTGNTSVSYSLVGGTDTCIWAVVFLNGADDILTANWRAGSGTPTYSMTEVDSGSVEGGEYKVFYRVSPETVTAGEVRVTFSDVNSDHLIYVFETDNTHQTSPGVVENLQVAASGATTNVLFDTNPVSQNQLTTVAGWLQVTTLPTLLSAFTNGYEQSGTQSYGSDFLCEASHLDYHGLQIGYSDLDLTTSNDKTLVWSSSLATGQFNSELNGDFAFMRLADNGFAYVFAGNQVHKIDGNTTGGTDGTITKNVLLFPEYFRIPDAVDYRSNLYIAVHQYPTTTNTTTLNTYSGKCGIYVWNRVSTQLSSADFIEIPGIREIKKIYASPDGVIKLITISDNGITQVRQFGYNDSGGVVFPVVRELGIGGYPQIPDGCTVAGDKTMWLANNGYLYCEKDNYVTKLHEISAPGTTSTGLAENITSGAVLYGSDTETADTGLRSNKQGIVVSYDDSGVTHEKIYPFDIKTGANGAQTPHQGDVYTPVFYIPTTSVVRRVRIYNAPVSSTGSTVIATVKMYFNQSTDATFPNGMTKSITLDQAKRGYVDFKVDKQYVHAVQLEFEWATGTDIGDDMYIPSAGIILTDEDTIKTPSKD